jgi:hypothetical protein
MRSKFFYIRTKMKKQGLDLSHLVHIKMGLNPPSRRTIINIFMHFFCKYNINKNIQKVI